jgi:hypothetical protein
MMDMLTSISIPNSPIISYLVAFLFMPIISFIFILVAHNMQRSSFPDLKDIYKRALILMIGVGVPLAIISMFPSLLGLDKIIGTA